jgi:hypothetical protein
LATGLEIRDASLQFVRKLGGFKVPRERGRHKPVPAPGWPRPLA